MPRNCNHQDNEVKQDHKDDREPTEFQWRTGFEWRRENNDWENGCWKSGFLMLGFAVLVTTFVYFKRDEYGELVEEGAWHIDRMRPGFRTGNFTIVPREDPEQKENCDSLNQMVSHALANNQTKKVVSRLCPETMWRAIRGTSEHSPDEASDSTPCKVNVVSGTDEGQIAELNALSSVCKTLALATDYSDSSTSIGFAVIFLLSALCLICAVYHDRTARARPEERSLLEGRRGVVAYYGADEEDPDDKKEEEAVGKKPSVFSFGL